MSYQNKETKQKRTLAAKYRLWRLERKQYFEALITENARTKQTQNEENYFTWRKKEIWKRNNIQWKFGLFHEFAVITFVFVCISLVQVQEIAIVICVLFRFISFIFLFVLNKCTLHWWHLWWQIPKRNIIIQWILTEKRVKIWLKCGRTKRHA